MSAAVASQEYATVRVDAVQPHPQNPNQGDTALITESIEANGFYGALVIHKATGNILVGSHRWASARMAGIEELPALILDVDEERALRILTVDNATGRAATWNMAALVELLRGMGQTPGGLAGSGFTDAALMRLATELSQKTAPGPTLADQFLVAPFDVLDGRTGWWQQRRRMWLALGLKSEEGRFEDSAGRSPYSAGNSHTSRAAYRGGWARASAQRHGTRTKQVEILGRKLEHEEMAADNKRDNEISIFDPVLCELAYRWFSPEGGVIVDPFAGGSVRGIVAAILGRTYRGNDLSAKQVAANVAQAARLLPSAGAAGHAQWDTGDSLTWSLEPESADMLLTCPPYYDTEVYTEHERDISRFTTAEFDKAYMAILANAGKAVRQDRFAVIVTGDSRGKSGYLRDLRGTTVRAMEAAGFSYCTGAVHVMPAWSLASTAARYFKGRRTLGRMHEDVMVFVKGSASKAAKALGAVEVAFPDIPADANGATGEGGAVGSEVAGLAGRRLGLLGGPVGVGHGGLGLHELAELTHLAQDVLPNLRAGGVGAGCVGSRCGELGEHRLGLGLRDASADEASQYGFLVHRGRCLGLLAPLARPDVDEEREAHRDGGLLGLGSRGGSGGRVAGACHEGGSFRLAPGAFLPVRVKKKVKQPLQRVIFPSYAGTGKLSRTLCSSPLAASNLQWHSPGRMGDHGP